MLYKLKILYIQKNMQILHILLHMFIYIYIYIISGPLVSRNLIHRSRNVHQGPGHLSRCLLYDHPAIKSWNKSFHSTASGQHGWFLSVCEMVQMARAAKQPRYATAMLFHSNQPETYTFRVSGPLSVTAFTS